MTVALIDDRLLAAVLTDRTPRQLRGRDLATTGCWYVRMNQAVPHRNEHLSGGLSGFFTSLPDSLRPRAIAQVLSLPPDMELLSLRELAPTIGEVRGRHALNLLSAEVVAAATTLGATTYLSAPSPRLEAALESEGLTWRHVAVASL